MAEQADKTFIKNFSLIVVGLTLITVVIVFVARDVGFKEEIDAPSRRALAEERVRPVADVYTGEAGAAAIEKAVAEKAMVEKTVVEPSPKPAGAFDGSLDGEMIYTSVCAACHATAIAGAPQPGSAEMAQRAEKGLDALLQTAINGLNVMPARGGRPDLSDEQIRASVEFMLQ